MNKLKFFLPVMVLVVIAASCAKDKKIERRLTKKDGKWNIIEMTESSVTNGTTDYQDSHANAGNIVFDDETFVWNSNYDGDTYSFGGTWANTSDKLSFIASDGEAITFDIEDSSRKEMKLKWTETETFDGNTSTYTTTMTLERD